MRRVEALPGLIAIAAACVLSVSCDKTSGSAPGREREELALKAACAEAGKKARKEWLEQYHGEHFSDSPEYAYSASLKTCLYADSYDDTGGNPLYPTTVREVAFVLDVYSNKILVEYTAYDGKPLPGSPSRDEFDKKKAALMGK